jgi:hypothetical protein
MSWCPKHWKPYQKQPAGLVLTVKIMQMFMSHTRVHEFIKDDHSASAMNRAMQELGPACCLLGDEYLATLQDWLKMRTCKFVIAQGQNCHKPEGHPGDHDHFWPPHPDMAKPRLEGH